jgi:hypothetical protein
MFIQRFIKFIFGQKSFAAALKSAIIFNPRAPAAAAETG